MRVHARTRRSTAGAGTPAFGLGEKSAWHRRHTRTRSRVDPARSASSSPDVPVHLDWHKFMAQAIDCSSGRRSSPRRPNPSPMSRQNAGPRRLHRRRQDRPGRAAAMSAVRRVLAGGLDHIEAYRPRSGTAPRRPTFLNPASAMTPRVFPPSVLPRRTEAVKQLHNEEHGPQHGTCARPMSH